MGNGISFHFSLSFLCLDKFYKNRNGIKSNFDRKLIVTSKQDFDSSYWWYFDSLSKEIM